MLRKIILIRTGVFTNLNDICIMVYILIEENYYQSVIIIYMIIIHNYHYKYQCITFKAGSNSNHYISLTIHYKLKRQYKGTIKDNINFILTSSTFTILQIQPICSDNFVLVTPPLLHFLSHMWYICCFSVMSRCI